MSDGIITRIGKWIDSKFEDKPSMAQVLALEAQVDTLAKIISDAKLSKELSDLKTRVERIEVYSGLKRVIDPTKSALEKSAFSM